MSTRSFGSTLAARTLLTLTLGFAAIPAFAQDARIPYPPAVTPEMLDRHTLRITPPEKVAPGQYRIGEIVLDKTEKSLSFPAVVNMNKGLLEYLLVSKGGKTHESLLRTGIEPYNLQIACLLLGLEGGGAPLSFQGDPATPKGDEVDITLRIKGADGKDKTLRPEAWMVQVVGEAKRDVAPLNWVYSGSMVQDGRFGAQVGGSIAAVYHDPIAMIDNASPGGESDKVWFVREEAAPPVGTPVTVIIRSKKP